MEIVFPYFICAFLIIRNDGIRKVFSFSHTNVMMPAVHPAKKIPAPGFSCF